MQMRSTSATTGNWFLVISPKSARIICTRIGDGSFFLDPHFLLRTGGRQGEDVPTCHFWSQNSSVVLGIRINNTPRPHSPPPPRTHIIVSIGCNDDSQKTINNCFASFLLLTTRCGATSRIAIWKDYARRRQTSAGCRFQRCL
jgi:hypothetical protein